MSAPDTFSFVSSVSRNGVDVVPTVSIAFCSVEVIAATLVVSLYEHALLALADVWKFVGQSLDRSSSVENMFLMMHGVK